MIFRLQICTPVDAANKAHIIINTLPRVWLQQSSIIESLDLFMQFLRSLMTQLDSKNSLHRYTCFFQVFFLLF